MRTLKDLERYTVHATDGDVGRVEDFLLDDERWAIRYLVVNAGSFLDGRRVLVSPISLRDVEWSARSFHLSLTVEKVKNSPSIDTAKPVSRQHEWDYFSYYGYPFYWGGAGVWGTSAYPSLLGVASRSPGPTERSDQTGDVHLRSAHELRGYHVQGSDEAIGHVQDFIVDEETWEVRYLVVDTSNWWFGKKVLVAPGWATRVSWPENKVYVDLSREVIKSAPEWKADVPIDREYEARLHDHYGRPAYWGGASSPLVTPPPAHDSSSNAV